MKLSFMQAKIARLMIAVLIALTAIPSAAPHPASAAASAVLFQDDFQDGDTAGWTFVGAAGSWSVAADSANAAAKMLQQANGASTEAYATAGSLAWTDYSFQSRVRLLDDGPYPGILARYKDSNNYYMFRLNPTNLNKLELSKKVNGVSTTLGTYDFPTAKGTWYTLKLVLQGSSIKAYMNDVRIFAVTDTSLTAGEIGFRTKWGQAAFDDIQVTDLAGMPAAPANVQAGPATATTVPLTWDPVTDAAYYRAYRATSAAGPYQQIYRGVETSFRDTGLTPQTAYYYKVSAENGGLESADSSAISAATAAVPAGPTGLASTGQTDKTITLKWDPVSGAAAYKLYRSTSASGTFTNIYTGTGTSYTDTGLGPARRTITPLLM